jgi:hypothetical protein
MYVYLPTPNSTYWKIIFTINPELKGPKRGIFGTSLFFAKNRYNILHIDDFAENTPNFHGNRNKNYQKRYMSALNAERRIAGYTEDDI